MTVTGTCDWDVTLGVVSGLSLLTTSSAMAGEAVREAAMAILAMVVGITVFLDITEYPSIIVISSQARACNAHYCRILNVI